MAEAVLYYRAAGGVLASRVASGETVEAPELPDGATPLTEAEYTAALNQVEAEREAYKQEVTANDESNQQTDYQALRASGIPETTARRLSGYTGPDGSV
ncbi:hypothetical protein [Streptomyces afghaniensis]|uniref:hypothetical protein n=1 Tax=Streptomyces afghaniensis TaxID=66865 RepID=UPI00277D601E|nr:hypothetical protein [Streptomyces afghaniensis]MDQ1018967.1 hypothetical protein [Streptomyces afghaniensis]